METTAEIMMRELLNMMFMSLGCSLKCCFMLGTAKGRVNSAEAMPESQGRHAIRRDEATERRTSMLRYNYTL